MCVRKPLLALSTSQTKALGVSKAVVVELEVRKDLKAPENIEEKQRQSHTVSWGDWEDEGALNCREVERRKGLEAKVVGPWKSQLGVQKEVGDYSPGGTAHGLTLPLAPQVLAVVVPEDPGGEEETFH